jgi:hypothetical protein
METTVLKKIISYRIEWEIKKMDIHFLTSKKKKDKCHLGAQ